MVAGQRGTGVIRAFHQNGLQKIPPRVTLAGSESEAGRFDAGVLGLDGDHGIKVPAAADEQSGEEFLGAGRHPWGVGIFLEKNLTASRVDHDGRLRGQTGGVGRPDWRITRRNGHG